MATSKPRVNVPGTARAGEVITIKTLIRHRMESGFRKDKEGKLFPRKLINKFECRFNDHLVFSVDMHSAISANPYLSFSARVSESGTFHFRWFDDDGSVIELSKAIEIA